MSPLHEIPMQASMTDLERRQVGVGLNVRTHHAPSPLHQGHHACWAFHGGTQGAMRLLKNVFRVSRVKVGGSRVDDLGLARGTRKQRMG